MLIPTYNMSTAICWYDNAVPNQLCDDIIELFESHKDRQAPGMTMKGVGDVKVSTDMSIFPTDFQSSKGISTELETYVSGFMQDAIYDYVLTFDWLQAARGTTDTGCLIQKYEANRGKYGEHIDGDPWDEYLNTRICGIIVYLNTVQEGGGTYFRYQDTYIDAVQGRIAIFPASWTHPHTGTIPVSNDKYIISSFLHPLQVNEMPDYVKKNMEL